MPKILEPGRAEEWIIHHRLNEKNRFSQCVRCRQARPLRWFEDPNDHTICFVCQEMMRKNKEKDRARNRLPEKLLSKR